MIRARSDYWSHHPHEKEDKSNYRKKVTGNANTTWAFALHTPAAQEAHRQPKEFRASDPPPQEASARKIRANFDERLQSRCSQPHGNACEFPPPSDKAPRKTEHYVAQQYFNIQRGAPGQGGLLDARTSTLTAERVMGVLYGIFQ
jgi:hypothetical protein